MNLTGRQLKIVGVLGLLAFAYLIYQLVMFAGVVNLLIALYVCLGFMVAFEARSMSGANLLETLLVAVFWLPMVSYGLGKKLYKGEKMVDYSEVEKEV